MIYDELSKANTHSRTAYTEKLSALTAEHTKLQAQVTGKTSSGPSTSETPKVLAPGMYNLGSKYIPPPKRANWVKSTQLPKTKQVTFIEPPRPSLKPTQKPVVHHNKQPNVCVPMSTGVKPTSGASKPVPKRAPRNHSSLPAKSANARRVEAHHRTLNKKNRVDSNLLVKHSVFVSNSNNDCGACNKSLVFSNHNACLVMCDDSVNDKPHPTKRSTRQPTKEWKPINKVGKPIKRVWNSISKNIANTKPQWKPTGRHFSLYEMHPLTRIMEPSAETLALSPSVSSSAQITMISRFPDCKFCDPQSGSKGISGLLRTASIRKSDTSVLEDLKALSWKTCQEGSLLNLSDHSKYEHVRPKFSEWRIEEKITSNSRKSEIKMKLSNLVIQVSKIEFLQKHKYPDYSSKNHVRKFLRALPLKWRANVMAIKEAKDLAILLIDELIGNLKVYEMILASDGVASKPIKEKVMPIALKANVTRGQTSNDSVCQDGSDDDKDEKEEFTLIVKNL
ncbi:hypothetical protein Tco_1393779 [Tanacetum coccineum]